LKIEEKVKKDRLIAIVCDDLGKRFRLRYFFDERGKGVTFTDVNVEKNNPVVKSVSELFPPADFYEREIHDFYGVEFQGNKNLHLKLFLPEDWDQKPPMRREKNA